MHERTFDIKHGLIAIKPREEGYDVFHFVGFDREPTVEDRERMRDELWADEDFGVKDIVDLDELLIIQAPEEIVSAFRDLAIDDGVI